MARLDSLSKRGAVKAFLTVVATLLAITAHGFQGQSAPPSSEQAKWAIRIAGVTEPPELSGEPKNPIKPTAAQREFGDIVGTISEKDKEKTKTARLRLSTFIEEHPGYSDAFFLRATSDLCVLESHDYVSILRDTNTAISTHQSNADTIYQELSDHYSLRGKVKMLLGQRSEALDDMDAAMKANLSSPDSIFNISGTEPTRTSNPCEWNLADLDKLVSEFSTDYRALLLRGLYFQFFTRFNIEGKYYPDAAQDFDKAATLNPKSPLPHYFLGNLYRRASVFTKAAASSDENQNEIRKKAIAAYTAAIHVDPKFRPAYEDRASQFLNIKEYQQAIVDYDQVLKFDPDNTTAYADRGLTQFLVGQFQGAISSYGEAIRRKKDDDRWLAYDYDHQGDAYVAIGDLPHAIADYSEAIKRTFGNETILLSLKQIRALYPEYDHIADDVLLRRIHDLFWPQMEYVAFADSVSKKEGKWAIGDLHELYQKRGDAYLNNNDFRSGVRDFNRIYKGIPDYADGVDRWRSLGKGRDGTDQQIDVKAIRFPGITIPQLTFKSTAKDGSYTVQIYAFDCDAKKIEVLGTRSYDVDDQELQRPTQTDARWHTAPPNSMEQRLYTGICSDKTASK